MDEVSGFKIFQMNDCDWWMAPTLEEAVRDVKETYGDEPEMWEDAHELTEAGLDKMQFTDFDDDGDPIKRSFREELQRRIAAGPKTEMFASTEF